MKNRLVRSWVLGLWCWVILVLAFCPLPLFGEGTLDFSVPAPPASKLIGNDTLAVLGKNVQCAYYLSSWSQSDITNYYQSNLAKDGFKITLEDKKTDKVKLVRFKRIDQKSRQELVLDFVLSIQPQGTKVSIGKYLQPQGGPDLENLPLSLQDKSLFSLPKTDNPGEDLPNVPRPPQGIRLASMVKNGAGILLYSSALTAEEVREFYRDQMPAEGWEIKNDVSAGAAMDAYKKNTHKSSLGIQVPLTDGQDFEEVISGAYVLDFGDKVNKVRITVMPNFIEIKDGSMIQINYNLSK